MGRFNGTDELHSGFIGGAEVGIEIKKTFLSLQGSHLQQEMRNGLDPSGSVTLLPLTLNLGGIWAKKPLSVRISGGVGVVLSDFQISKEIEKRNKWSNETIGIDLDDGICYQIQGGIERRLNERTSIGFEVGYLIYETLLRETRTTKIPYDLTMSTIRETTAPFNFNSVIGKVVLRFK